MIFANCFRTNQYIMIAIAALGLAAALPMGAQTTPVITTVAGCCEPAGRAGFSGDGAPAISAELHAPQGVAVDAAGNFYVADTNNNVIRKVSAATGIIATVAG